MVVILHLKTQDSQPYGSARLCCEKCGLLMNGQCWTNDRKLYMDSPVDGPKYVRCEDNQELDI